MKAVIKFKYENENYILIQDHDKLKPGKIKNNKIIYNLTLTEKKLIETIFKRLIPTKLSPIRKFNFNNKQFIHFTDKKTFLNIFYEVVNKKLIKPSNDSLRKLNSIFNNQSEYCFVNYIKKQKDQNFFKRFIKIGKKTIVVLVSSTFFLLTPLPEIVYAEHQYQLESIENRITTNRELLEQEFYSNSNITKINPTVDEIISTIKNNNKLKNEEKELFLSHPEFFIDNINYFDRSLVLETLQILEVEYHNESHSVNDKKAAGTFYRTFDNNGKVNKAIINIYNSDNFYSTKKSVLTHEFCHVFQKHGYFGSAFKEFLNTVFNSEYFGKDSDRIYDNGYYYLSDVSFALCEIIDNEEILKKYYTNPNPKYIIDELTKIIDDENEAIKVLVLFDTLNQLINYDDQKEEFKKVETELKNLLKKYYETKTSEKLQDNSIMEFYLDKENFYQKTFSNANTDEFIKYSPIIIKNKTYFNKDNQVDPNGIKINVFTEYKKTFKYVTEQQILNGIYGYKVNSVKDITLEKITDGIYKIPVNELIIEIYFIEDNHQKTLKMDN